MKINKLKKSYLDYRIVGQYGLEQWFSNFNLLKKYLQNLLNYGLKGLYSDYISYGT